MRCIPGSSAPPRRVVSLHHPWFIDTRRYSCSRQSCTADLKDKKNGFRFNGTDADSRKHLPLSAQLVFTVLLTHKSAADEKLTKFAAENQSTMSVAEVTDQITRYHHDHFYHLQLSYM